jgi:hypothetical protein
MKIWPLSVALLLVVITAKPCSIASVRKLWAKNTGSNSRLFAFEKNGRVGFIDSTGKIAIQAIVEARIEDVGDFSNGRARIGHQGYIDEGGIWAIKGDYRFRNDFSNGIAVVLEEDPSEKYGYHGLFLNTAGKVVAKVPAFRTGELSEGLASYEAEGKPSIRKFEPHKFIYRDFPGMKGFIDRTGSVVIRPAFAEVGPFVGGLARAVLDGYCHIAMADGGAQGTPTTGYPTSCGGAPEDAISTCAVGFIDQAGNFAIQPRFESARDFQEKLAAVRIGGLWGFIDTDSRMAIAPRFEQARSFQEGLAAIKIEGKWGFVDKAGEVTIPPRFEEVESFSDSLAIAYERGRPFFIDRRGKTQVVGPFREATSFVQGLAAVLLTDRRVAYIDKSGKTVFEYDRH